MTALDGFSVHYAEQAAAASVPELIDLLHEARAFLPPEQCGGRASLAGRIDVALYRAASLASEPARWDRPLSDEGLVWERLPNGELARLRP